MSIHDSDRSLHRQTTVAAIMVIAFMLACVAHEVVGHGGMCMIVGGHVNLVSSVYFRSTGGGVLTDAAGPLMNLFVGAVCWFLLGRWTAPPILWRLFLVLAMGFNLFWGAGCFILSAVTNTGDWAFVLRQLQLEPVWVWRIVLGVLGIFIYRWAMRLLASQLPIGTPLFVPYLATGIFSCFAALFFFGPVVPALREAALEGFGVGIGLLLLAPNRPEQKTNSQPDLVVPDGKAWLFTVIVLAIIFIATLGRGFGNAGAV
jgi:hypothetical protein